MSRRTIFVSGIGPHTRARDLAYEFERFGRLVRCDIPAPRNGGRPFAFVEYVREEDALRGYDELHGVRIDGAVPAPAAAAADAMKPVTPLESAAKLDERRDEADDRRND
ncbi:hypothetical protein H9P43_010081 [Blastocladiella emersonii ATCC 22665]|nr:hypothetical protein H9P43_010081 [Blastocladiella emersonii ATCC 22665]